VPAATTVSGGGTFCGSTTITASGGSGGTIYFQGTASGGTSTVTASSSEVITTPAANTYYFRSVSADGCWGAEGSANVTINAVPAATTVSGGGTFCGSTTITASGGSGGTIYFQGTTSGGTSIAAASSSQVVTSAGTYYFRSMSLSGCWGSEGSVSVSINPAPAIYTFTGGGGYCSGSNGAAIGLTLSQTGVEYKLYNSLGTAVSGGVAGTGSAISFGTYTSADYYYAIATNPATSCTSTLPGVTVHVDPLPDTFSVTGGGNYCSNVSAGVAVGLNGSQSGISYQLYEAAAGPVGALVPGTGAAIGFGLRPAGTYSVTATNTVTGCSTAMDGSALIDLYPSPSIFNIVGGGAYCLGGSSVNISLDGSQIGVNYQLIYLGILPIGSTVAGTGAGVSLGDYLLPGDYIAIATDTTTGCMDTMNNNASITFNLPPAFFITGGGGGYCVGDSGVHITLSGSSTGVRYQLFRADTAIGLAVNGTGSTLDFGLFTTVGTYSVQATDTATGCISNMFSSATVTVNPVVAPSVTLNTGLTSGNRVCYGNMVTFTAHTAWGGTNPVYEWKVNNVNVPGPIDSVFSYIPVDSDIVWVRMTSNSLCASPMTATNAMVVDVDTFATPSVFINVDPQTSVTPGTNVTLTALVTNGGPLPQYQWYKNGVIIPGATNAAYSSTGFVNGDSLCCKVVSSGGCAGAITFNCVVLHIFGVEVPNVRPVISDVRLVPNPNKGSFSVTGTLATHDAVEAYIEIVNVLGQSVYEGKTMIKNGILDTQIQLDANLANGMYILNLRAGADRKVFHFVLEQ